MYKRTDTAETVINDSKITAPCHNVCNQLPSLSPDESMTLPGSFVRPALLIKGGFAVYTYPCLGI